MPTAKTAKARVGLLFADAVEQARCAEYVEAMGHEAVVSTPATARLEEWTDISILIADLGAVEHRGPDLKALKNRVTADFRYFPLVIALSIHADYAPWFAFGFDDVLRTPVQREALQARIEIWLRLREETECHYRSFVEGGPIGVFRMTSDGRLLYANPALVQMLAFSSFEELEQQDQKLQISLPNWPRSSSFASIVRSDRGGTAWRELSWVKADGTRLYVRESVRPIRDATGQVLYYEGMVEDITARVALEERMTAICELGRALIFTRDEREIAQATTETACDVLEIEDCALFLVDPDERKLVFAACATGHAPPGPVEFPLAAEQGIMVAVARTGETVCLLDVTADQRYIGGTIENRSKLCVPIKAEKKVLGVLNAASPIPNRFGPAEKQLLTVLANQVATAIANARLFAETQRLEAFNERIVQGMSEGILIEDAAGTITFANPALAEMLRYGPGELLGKHWQAIMPLEHRDRVSAEIAKRPVGVAGRYETTLLRKDGRQVPVVVSARSFTQNGRLTGVLSVFTDITALRESQQALQAVEQHLHNIVEHSAELFYACDTNHVLTYVSPQSQHFLGCEPEAAMRYWTEFVTDNPVNTRGYEAIERAIETGQRQPSYELELKAVRGNIIWVEVRESPVVVNGKTIAIVGSFTDITKHKRAEEERARNQARVQALFEGIVQTLESTVRLRDPYTASHQERVAELACAISRELGLPQAEMEGLRIIALVHDIGKTVVPIEILSKSGKLSENEMNIVRGHVQAGYDVLKGIEFLWPVATTVLQHHERLDGSGYPHGLKGEEISLWARILIVADVVEAMSSHRPYRPARGLEAALTKIDAEKGRLYAPAIVDACVSAFRQGFAFSITD